MKKRSQLPDFRFEKEVGKKFDFVVGVDEVGRGALAGSVVAGAVALIGGIRGKGSVNGLKMKNWLGLGIDDSKCLTAKKREKLAEIIRSEAVWAVGEASVAYINRYGIVKATERAMRKAVAELKLHRKGRVFVLVDAFHIKYVPGVGMKNQKAIVKGDQKSISIAAASIVAKVHRDSLMVKLAKKHPKYLWEENKGYGTKAHLQAIKKHGVTRLHRKDFI